MRVINYQPSYPTDSQRGTIENAEQLKIPVGLVKTQILDYSIATYAKPGVCPWYSPARAPITYSHLPITLLS